MMRLLCAPAAAYAQQVFLHSSFRQEVLLDPAAAEAAAVRQSSAAVKRESPEAHAEAAAAKRRRWQQQVQDCMGSTDGASTVCSSQVVDVVHMVWASPAALTLQSVDGSVLCQHDAAVQGGSESAAVRRPGPSSLHTWAYACPITGQMWMPARG